MPYKISSLFFFTLLVFFPARPLAQEPGYPLELKKLSPTLTITDMGSWKPIRKGAEFREVILERIQPHYLISLKMVRVDTLWIVPRIVLGLRYNLKETDVKTLAEKSGAMAMINANYFDEKGRPLGFLKLGSDKINRRVSKSSLYTGIFGTKNRRPFISHRDQFSPDQSDDGLQAGPLLITKRKILSVTRGAGKHSRRSLIGIDKDQRLIIAVTDNLLGGLSWVELQRFFSSSPWQMNVTDLLNLDGGGSAQLYVKGFQFEEHVQGTTNVPVAIGFFKKSR